LKKHLGDDDHPKNTSGERGPSPRTAAQITGTGRIFCRILGNRNTAFARPSPDTKTAEPRRIYFNDDLQALFKELGKFRRIRHKAVFTYRGKPIDSIRKSFREACTKAGVRDFRIHDLRHTFNTNMRKTGVDRSVIMKITGHKTTAMFERYNTVDSEDARSAMDRYEGFLRNQITSGLLHDLPEGNKEGQPEWATL
jgi:integrase